jgi:ATP-grasp domain, R2K clade family 3
MLIVFPANPVASNRPDPAFEEEVAAARTAGFVVGFANLESHFDGDLSLRVPNGEGRAMYRGWILRVEDYARLELGLAERGYRLLTTAASYQHCYFLPEWYAAVGCEMTPRSIWFPGRSFHMAEVKKRVQAEFGVGSIVLKDYVKSRKHEWFDACFLRSVADEAELERIVSNFLRLQGDALVGGLVFREFIEFKRIGFHSKSRMPLVREFRFFVFDGKLVTQAPYWGEGQYEGPTPSPEILTPVLPRIKSRFFAIDVAQKEDGAWLIMEVNDGGSAGIPEGSDVGEFYERLAVLVRQLSETDSNVSM